MTTKTIGFIGAGRIGRPMIRALLAAGYPVKVYDKFRSAAEDVIAQGAVWAETPAKAATGAQVVITCLARPEHVTECMLGRDGAVGGMAAGSTWVNTSTTDYHATTQIAQSIRQKGAFGVEGPVSNLSHMGVDFGNSSIYCAGDKQGYDAVRDVLETITKVSFFTGEIGTAQAVKLLTNHLFYGCVSIAGDCLALSQNAGIPTHWMWHHIMTSQAQSVPVDQFMPMVFDGSYDNSCSLEIGIKDMKLTVTLADELGVALPLGRAVSSRYALAGEVYDPAQNHMKVVKLTEDANDLKIRIPAFAAPSKYGIDPNYMMGPEMEADRYGRLTPRLPAYCTPPPFHPSPAQQTLVDLLTRFLTLTNHTLTLEAFELGKAVGLEPAKIEEMIIWSVGTNWVVENLSSYVPDSQTVPDMARAAQSLHLPYIGKVINALDD